MLDFVQVTIRNFFCPSLGVETQRGSRCEAPASFDTHDGDIFIVRLVIQTNLHRHGIACSLSTAYRRHP